MALFECVPNVSEGRRRVVIDACASAIGGAGARLLDVSSDSAHHRSVYTFVGSSEQLLAAVLALFNVAAARIDLRHHTGEHPRLGAVDVVPFVPLAGAEMAECVELARRAGAEVADRHGIPVFLYEEAATRPERRRLEDIRRGGFEGLASKTRQAIWTPDFGPSVPHPTAGASVIGARRVLIAYNVNLRSTDLAVAKTIAAAVRESSGGLPFVKAMGVILADRGVVQVSMNLTNFERTSMLAAFERVASEAAARGIEVIESEIVGLVPAAALPADPKRALRLDQKFGDDQILENRISKIS
jgi:glutamate formiminotransferase